MKLIDAIRNVVRPENPDKWDFMVCGDEINRDLNIDGMYFYPEELSARFKAYPIYQWICTDTYVGLMALYLDNEPVGCTYQSSRKGGMEVEWISREIANTVRTVVCSYMENTDTASILDPDQDIGDDFNVQFTGQALTDDGFYEGRPVKVLVQYDSIRTTPPGSRRKGHSYLENAPYGHKNYGCVKIQDGDEQRVIPITEFKMAFNVKAPD